MQQVNTLGIAVGGTIDIGRQTATNGGLPRAALCRLTQGGQRFFKAIRALLRQITSDPQPNSAYYLGTYVPLLDTTQPPAQMAGCVIVAVGEAAGFDACRTQDRHLKDAGADMTGFSPPTRQARMLALCAPPQAVFGTGRCRA